mmetsp:Transcript_18898/g.36262  ORF Transcript_18898/g.36262 Transcript_18898/m.36262 type:complete len:216 (-) Transcript_18898:18-665(-)
MWLDEHKSHVLHRSNFAVDLGDSLGLSEAFAGVDVFHCVKQRSHATIHFNLRILGPSHDSLVINLQVKKSLAKRVLCELHLSPVQTFAQSLERASRSVHAIIASVRLNITQDGLRGMTSDKYLALESKLFILSKDLSSERIFWGLSWVRRPEDLSAEICPREIFFIPLYDEIVDRSSFCNEFFTHGHVKAVDDVAISLRTRRSAPHNGPSQAGGV